MARKLPSYTNSSDCFGKQPITPIMSSEHRGLVIYFVLYGSTMTDIFVVVVIVAQGKRTLTNDSFAVLC